MTQGSSASAARAKVRVVAALIPEPGAPQRFLVQQRLPGKSRALLWEFPGGKVELGETDAQALARECREELAVELDVGATLWSCLHEYADLTVELVLIGARLRPGVGAEAPQALGANALRWASPDEMKALPFCEADLPLLDALASGEVRWA